jgi:hypothetical protein
MDKQDASSSVINALKTYIGVPLFIILMSMLFAIAGLWAFAIMAGIALAGAIPAAIHHRNTIKEAVRVRQQS